MTAIDADNDVEQNASSYELALKMRRRCEGLSFLRLIGEMSGWISGSAPSYVVDIVHFSPN
jgi:hypothetical protein